MTPSMKRAVQRSAAGLATLAALTLVAAPVSAQGGMQMGEKPGQAPLSPRDSLKVSIAGADLSVNYGRPSKRGRAIFNGLADMKWGMVWRTGANEATVFTTSKALDFGGKVVPAGKYTLWTKLEEHGKWELIVNKQTGQWGTDYDAKQDLVHIPMTVVSNGPVVEKMEIQIKPAGKGGELVVRWDTYEAKSPFVVR